MIAAKLVPRGLRASKCATAAANQIASLGNGITGPKVSVVELDSQIQIRICRCNAGPTIH